VVGHRKDPFMAEMNKVFARMSDEWLRALDRLAAEKYEGNRSMALRSLIRDGLQPYLTEEDDHVEPEPADQPQAG
jgi:metal-responsive CopG/Arc/MetJ family transcriptional regulator